MGDPKPPSNDVYLVRAIIIVGAAAWLIMLGTALAPQIRKLSQQAMATSRRTAVATAPASRVPATPGLTVQANTPEPFPTSSIPTPDPKSIQAEVSLLAAKASADGKSVQVSVSILNTGVSSFTFSNEDVTLTAQDGEPVKLLKVEPGLPQSFKPSEPKTITLTFTKPSSLTATLKIFDVEYDVEGY